MRSAALVTAVVVGACGLAACKRTVSGDEAPSDGGAGADPGAGAYVDPNPGAALPADAAWVAKASGTKVALNGVWAAPDLALVVAVGESGTILASSDRGETWSPRPSGTQAKLRAVWGSSARDVYAVGDASTLLHSLDGGATWQAEIAPSTNLWSVWGSSAKNVFVGGENANIYRSRDEGDTWRALSTPALTRIASIWGVSATQLFAVAEVGLLSSSSSGDKLAWTGTSISQQLGVWASAPDDIYTVNGLGVVTHWTGTETLYKTELTPVRTLYGVWGTSANDVYAVGAQGRIVHTSDRGQSYAPQRSGTTEDLHAIHGASGVVFTVGGAGAILVRSGAARVDGGAGDASAADATTD